MKRILRKIKNIAQTLEKHKGKLVVPLLLIIIFSMVFVRIQSVDAVITPDRINLLGNDAYYHMRLVEHTIQNWPERTFFDPGTFYPYGGFLYFGPIWTYINAFAALIIGMGAPSLRLQELILAAMPVIFGALTAIPVYFLGKEVFKSRTAGLGAAVVLALTGGQFLSRTMFGFGDHHGAEVFFSTLAVMFFIYALAGKKHRQYAVAAGLAFSLYLLTWSAGIMFAFIGIVYVVTQALLNFLHKKDNQKLIEVTAIAFGLPILAILPYLRPVFDLYRYSFLHVGALLAPVLILILLDQLSKRFKTNKQFFGVLSLGSVGLYGALSLLVPSVIGYINRGFSVAFGLDIGSSVIAEARPLFLLQGRISADQAFQNYGFFLFIAMVVAFVIIIDALRKNDAKLLFVSAWSVILFLMTLAHIRYLYYLAIPVAVISGYFIQKMLQHGKLVTLVVVLLAVSIPTGMNSFYQSQFTSGMPDDWYDALTWLRENSPDPGFDFYGVYDKKFVEQERFEYPEGMYGIMSWWDYGHWIQYVAHRAPNSNPFQQGVTSIDGNDVTHFLLAQTPAAADEIMIALDSKYVIMDARMAEFVPIYVQWANEPLDKYIRTILNARSGTRKTYYMPEYFRTMNTRLFLYKGREVQPSSSTVITISNMTRDSGIYSRVVDEREFDNYSQALNFTEASNREFEETNETSKAFIVSNSKYSSPVPLEALSSYELVYEEGDPIAWTPELGYLKSMLIFEFKPQ